MRKYAVGDEPVPGYRLVRFLGAGNYSHVWQAVGPGEVEVALKINAMQDRQGLKEFRAVGLMKNIRHPNLSPLYAFWLKDEQGNLLTSDDPSSIEITGPTELFIAMGLGEKTLAQRLDECKLEFRRRQDLPENDPDDRHLLKRLKELGGSDLAGIPLSRLMDYIDQAAQGIDYLNQPIHVLGNGPPVAIQHRDIKPANLLLVGNGVQVCDYGLARAQTVDARATQAAGTPAYMAPELFSGDPSRWTDQYSLALTYYELRTGQLPFDEHELSLFQLMLIHNEGKLDYGLVPPAEQEVLRRATRPKPNERYPRTIDFARALDKATLPVKPKPTSLVDRPASPSIDRPTDVFPSPSVVLSALQVGQELVPGYRLVRRLGRVGPSEVWEAKGPGGMERALKLIHDIGVGKGQTEFRSLDRVRDLDHAHLVRMHGYWLLADDGRVIPEDQLGQADAPHAAALVMAADLAAKNLQQSWQECQNRGEAGIPVADLIRYMRAAAEGIDYLNSQEPAIVHRDIKPENLLLSKNDRVKVNIGLATLVEGSSVEVQTASASMTPYYSAPELFLGKVSRRTDQYSLALSYYKLRTGRLPFAGTPSPAEVFLAHTKGRLDLSAIAEAERAILTKATSIDPEERYDSCDDLIASLAVAVGLAPASHPVTAAVPSNPQMPAPVTPTWPSLELTKTGPPPVAAITPPPSTPETPRSWSSLTLTKTEPPPEAAVPPKPPAPPVQPVAPKWKSAAQLDQPAARTERRPVSTGLIAAVVALLVIVGGGVAYVVYPRTPPDPIAELQKQATKDVDRLLGEQKFADAVARVRAAERENAGAEWATGQHDRVRAAWRKTAEAKQPTEARLQEYEAVLKEFPDDKEARALADKLRPRVELERRQKQIGDEVGRLLNERAYAKAADRARAAQELPADADWIAGLHQRVCDAWRKAAEAISPDQDQLAELEALLAVYANDEQARALAARIRELMDLRARARSDVDDQMREGNFVGAHARVRAAEVVGAGAAWVTAQHERIRAAWRQAAGALRTDEDKRAAYGALVQRYPDDTEAMAALKLLRARLTTRESMEAEVQRLVTSGDFHGAAEQVKAAVAAGSDRAWAAARHRQIRDAWRTAAAAKPAEEDQLTEFEALLKDYDDDEDAKARADKIRTTIELQKQSAGEIEKLLTGRDYKGAAEKVRSARNGGASEAWVTRQDDQVRKVWLNAAEAKRTTDEQSNELQTLLAMYPKDPNATASLDRIRGAMTRLDNIVKDVDRHLAERKFHEAAAAVKVAVRGGAGETWATAQHERIRAKWREAAAAKSTDEARAKEFDDLLTEYANDEIARAESTKLRNRLKLQQEVGEEVGRLVGEANFKVAATRVQAAADQGAAEAWAKARHDQIRQAWHQRATQKATDDERLAEFDALLEVYSGDPATVAAANAIRKNIVAFRELDLEKTVKLKLVDIKPPASGTFRMGSPDDEPERDRPSEKAQDMQLTRGYLLGETEVTVAQFRRFVEDSKYTPKGLSLSPPLDWANPFRDKRQADDQPVVGVTWSDAVAFCNWLTKKTGRKCRLPYEAEWEYACRAGTTTPFSFGPKLSKGKAAFNCATPDTEAKLLDGPGSQAPTSTVPVRTYPANAWGLFGMQGNAAEWCADAYQPIPESPGKAPLAKDAGAGVARGGGWKSAVEECRSAYRLRRANNAIARDDIGFRICVER